MKQFDSTPNRFPKGPLLKVRPSFHRVFGKPLYARMANAAILYIGPLEISWRMPWLKEAVFQMGWDSAWRMQNGLGVEGIDYAIQRETAKGDSNAPSADS